MDQAVSSRKLVQTFQKAVELEHVLEQKAELTAALAELARSQESALLRALNQAVQRGLLLYAVACASSKKPAASRSPVTPAARIGTLSRKSSAGRPSRRCASSVRREAAVAVH